MVTFAKGRRRKPPFFELDLCFKPDYLVNFASTGNPNAEGLPEWKPYTQLNPNYVELNVTATPYTDLTPAAWDFFDKVEANKRSF